MIKSANAYPVSQIFDAEAKVVYAIPLYQREYSWGKSHWENLFDDMFDNNPGYFLGSIICINNSKDAFDVQELELVDGQQRLTTLSLLFAAVYRALKRYETDLNEDQRSDLPSLKRKMVLRKGNDRVRLILQSQNNNQIDYLAILSDIEIISKRDTPPYAGNRLIYRAYRYFQDRIERMDNERIARIEAIMKLLERINRAHLVKIEVESYAFAYTLFESLNNRGMPLTAIDLIKNRLLASQGSSAPDKIDIYFGQWNRLLGYLGDDYAIQERFFRHYYNAFRDELSAVYQVSVATRSNLIQIFEKLISHDAKGFLDKIIAAGKAYSVLLSRDQDDVRSDLTKAIKDLERIQGTPSHLLMLYLLVRRSQLELTDKHLTSIVELLVRFFARRNLTDTPPTRDLTRLFMDVIDSVRGERADAIILSIRQRLMADSASEDVFQSALKGSIYTENTGATRFVLCALAELAMTKESWVDLWHIENKRFVWTIEHIFPQGENIPQAWVAMVAGGDEKKAAEAQRTHVHKLGNLTITRFNSSLGNKSFDEKRDRKDQEGRAVGYKNGLKLNEDLASAKGWSVDQIDLRTEKLVRELTQLYQLSDSVE